MDYKSTINLPQTEFPMKADLAKREPVMVERWKSEDTYQQMLAARTSQGDGEKAAPRFILHDGPPYANGGIHFGHILNKTLKDIVVKSRAMMGYHTPFVPGWDCHGLPIELAVEAEAGGKQGITDVVAKRVACRAYAERFIALQREQFRRIGVFADWDAPYLTMAPHYQATIAREFAKCVASGAVYSGKRPIHWCCSCQTALAEAEVEYENHRSPSIHVAFPVVEDDAVRAWTKKISAPRKPLSILIWTTTPWTLPANVAVCLHPDFPYIAVDVGDHVWIVAEGLLEATLTATAKTASWTSAPFSARDLERCEVEHPFLSRRSLVILGDHVTLDAGTGCVHTAPGHGQEDYRVGVRYNLPVLAPVDAGGKFTEDAGAPWLTGLFVTKANARIIEELHTRGRLAQSSELEHQYPHCWRCKRPLIFRATEQWFISMEKTELRTRALHAIERDVAWIPEWGKNRINGMMAARPDWCISRQRAWGVPIIAVRCGACGERSTTPELIEHVAKKIDTENADCWYAQTVDELLPKNYACPHCAKSGSAAQFTKEHDILDVWFDSGSSFAAVVENRFGVNFEEEAKQKSEDRTKVLYLEGSDQHRGWFHTSLLIAEVTRHCAPYTEVLTHGFVVDGDGRKYSKSAKNYVAPEKVLETTGAEILRLWVAAEDYRNDIRVSTEIVDRCSEAYRKIRNTWRYMLGNLFDFNPTNDVVAWNELPDYDRYVLTECATLLAACERAYCEYEFHRVYHVLNEFCTVHLSARYFDIGKDRLYCNATRGANRRAMQTVLWLVADALVRISAPILSFTAEEVWPLLPAWPDHAKAASVFAENFVALSTDAHPCPDAWKTLLHIDATWSDAPRERTLHELFAFREAVQKQLEVARADKIIGNSLGAKVHLSRELSGLSTLGASLADFLLVSQVQRATPDGKYSGEIVLNGEKITFSIHPADGQKCTRCWKFYAEPDDAQFPIACARCVGVLREPTNDAGQRAS